MGNAVCDGGSDADDAVLQDYYSLYKKGLTDFDIILLARLKRGLAAWKTMQPTLADCKAPSWTGQPAKHVNAGVLFPKVDEDWPEDGLLGTLFSKFTYSRPIEYKFDEWESVQHAQKFLPQYVGDDYPSGLEFDNTWPSRGTNDAFTWMNFMAMGITYIRKVRRTDAFVPDGAVFISDMSDLYVYDVVPEFCRYGAAAYWNRDRKLMGIYVSYMNKYVEANDNLDEDMEWEHAKYVHSCSMVCYTQMITHLSMIHTMVANGLATACYEKLGVNHPLRRFLKPHVYRVIANNYKGSLFLIGPGGAIDRIFAFNHEQFDEFFCKETIKLKFRTIAQIIEDNEMGDVDQEFYSLKDGIGYHEIVVKYVRNYLDIFYRGDWNNVLADEEALEFWLTLLKHLGMSPAGLHYEEFVEVLANCLVYSTAVHECWGTITYAVQHPRQSGGRYKPGQYMSDVQNYVQTNLIAVAVTLKQLRLQNDWKYLLLKDETYARTSRVMDEFQADLVEYSKQMDALNQRRVQNGGVRCNFFDPQFLESGVSV